MPSAKKTKAPSTARKRTARKNRTASSSKAKSGRRWSASVHTESTFPEKGLFNKDASTIAKSLASKKTSPKGPASGMRMLNFYINRAGHNLPAARKKELEKAKAILSEIIARSGRKRISIKQKLSPQRH
jgi:tRNA(adenine34) deaminase